MSESDSYWAIIARLCWLDLDTGLTSIVALTMKKLIPIIVAMIFIAFPFLVHFGLQHLSAQVFSILLFLIFVPRIVLAPSKNKISKIIMGSIATLYCGTIAWFDSQVLLFYYPVLMSLFIATLFFISLFAEKSLIEEFAQLSGQAYPPEARCYMKALTKWWVVLLVLNAVVAAYTACCQTQGFWLIYNGMVSYGIMIAFIVLEWAYRGFHRRKYYPHL